MVTHLIPLRSAVSVELCDRFMAQGKRVYHLIMVAEHPDPLTLCEEVLWFTTMAAVSLTRQQYQQFIDRISRTGGKDGDLANSC